MPKANELYEQDFLLWTKEQATALRRATGSNLPLDWENLAEEVESLGASQRTELNSQIRRVLRHLFKLEACRLSTLVPDGVQLSAMHELKSKICLKPTPVFGAKSTPSRKDKPLLLQNSPPMISKITANLPTRFGLGSRKVGLRPSKFSATGSRRRRADSHQARPSESRGWSSARVSLYRREVSTSPPSSRRSRNLCDFAASPARCMTPITSCGA